MYTSALVYANSYMRQNWCQGSWTRTQIRINRIDAIWRLYHILLLTTCRMLSRRMTFQHGLLSINGRWQNHAVSAVIAHPASSFRFCLCEYITNSYSIQRSRWIYRGGNERIKMALTGMKRLDSFTIRFYTIQYSICGRLKVQDFILLNIGGRERPGTGERPWRVLCFLFPLWHFSKVARLYGGSAAHRSSLANEVTDRLCLLLYRQAWL